MARNYMILQHWGGAFLQIRETGSEVESIELTASTDQGRLREAEDVINKRFYSADPFPGFDWQPNKSGWFTSDNDYRGT